MIKRMMAAAAALMVAAPAFSTTIYQQDFESGSATGFTGGQVQSTFDYSGLGFGNAMLRSDSAVTLSLNLGQAVQGAKLSLSLGIIDTWDGAVDQKGESWSFGPDHFQVTLDGRSTPLFDQVFDNYLHTGATTAPGLTTLAYNQNLGYLNEADAAYTLELALGNLSAGIHTITFTAYGPLWQGGDDENFALDNVSITAGAAVPEPGTLALAVLGLGGLGLTRRRRQG